MTRVLGPPGVGLAPGATVAFRDEKTPWLVVSQVGTAQWWVCPAYDPTSWMAVDGDDLRLDLTEGPLDHGTRALWAVVSPATFALTAPSWTLGKDGDWALSRLLNHHRAEWLRFSSTGAPAWDRWPLPLAVPGISEERDPRRALAMALEAVCERRLA